MTKLSLSIAASIFLMLFMSSCFKGKGELVIEEILLPDLEGVTLRTSDKLIIQQSNDQKITIVGQQNVIDRINRDVVDGIWDIEFDRIIRSYEEMTITISTRLLTNIRLTSSGEIETDGQYFMQKGFLTSDGSGTITADIDVVEKLTMNLSSSGEMIVSGSCMSSDINHSGSGNIFSFGVDTDDADVSLSGSGSVELFADKMLNVNISGSGSVFYKGNPDITSTITGTGMLIDAN